MHIYNHTLIKRQIEDFPDRFNKLHEVPPSPAREAVSANPELPYIHAGFFLSVLIKGACFDIESTRYIIVVSRIFLSVGDQELLPVFLIKSLVNYFPDIIFSVFQMDYFLPLEVREHERLHLHLFCFLFRLVLLHR